MILIRRAAAFVLAIVAAEPRICAAFSPFRRQEGSSGSGSKIGSVALDKDGDTLHSGAREKGNNLTVTSNDDSSGRAAPERGKFLPNNANERDLYEAYADIQSDYESKAFFANPGDWTVLNDKHNVTVSILQHPDDPTCPYVKMRGIVPVPVDSCWNFLRVDNWDKSMPKMDPFYEGVNVHGEYQVSVADSRNRQQQSLMGQRKSASDASVAAETPLPRRGRRGLDKGDATSLTRTVRMILCRKRMRRLLTFGKRDLVFLSVTEDEPLADGTRVSGTVSVRTGRIPRAPGYTRAFQDSIAFYKPIENGTATDLTIVCRIDLNDSGADGEGGWVPMWIYVKTIGHTAAASIHKMRQALLSDQASYSDAVVAQVGNEPADAN